MSSVVAAVESEQCMQVAGGMFVYVARCIEDSVMPIIPSWHIITLGILLCILLTYLLLIYLGAHSLAMQRGLMYLCWTKIFTRYDRLQDLRYQGLSVNTRNVHVETEDGVHLHGYHMMPANLSAKAATLHSISGKGTRRRAIEDLFDMELAKANIIIIYFHGIALTRAFHYRLGTMTNLSNQFGESTHVVAFDYRGFGDVEGSPSEDGTRIDARAMKVWVDAAVQRGIVLLKACDVIGTSGINENKPKIVLYGHSMGASIATFLAADADHCVHGTFAGLILNGAFNCSDDAMECSKLSAILRVIPPAFQYVKKRYRLGCDGYKTEEVIENVPVGLPVLITHGSIDQVVPIHLGRKLFEKWISLRNALVDKEDNADTGVKISSATVTVAKIDFVEIEGAMHSDNFKFPQWTASIGKFLDSISI